MKKIILSILFLGLLASCASTNEQKELTPEEKKAELYYEQGTNLLVQKNYLEALTNLLKAKEFSPNDSRIRNNLGMAYYLKGQPELAITELKKAISLDEKNSDAKINLGTIYLEKKHNKDARQLYESAITNITFANIFRAYYNLALVDLADGDRKSAYENLARSLKEKEDYCPAHYKLGELYSEEYKFKDALASFREAAKGLCITEAAPQYQQAVTLVNLDRKSEAKKKFELVIEKFPKTKYKAMAINQIKQLEQNSAEEKITAQHKTEVITDSPQF